VLDAIEAVAVLVQPGERPDRPRREQEAVGLPQSTLQELLSDHGGDRDAGEVVVGERGVADVGRDEHLPLAVDHELGVGGVGRLRVESITTS
jgi:hypothetical protein